MGRKILVATIAALAVGALMMEAPRAGSDPVAKCLSSKQKASGKKIGGRLACIGKAAAKNVPIDPACVGKVDGKFDAAFAKADAKGACAGTTGGVNQTIGTCLTDVADLIPGTGKCTGSKLSASGKKASGKLACNAKATAKAIPIDPACLAKAEGKFAGTFAKADSKGACAGDAAAVEDVVDSECVDAVVAQLQVTPSTTTTSTTIPACGNGSVEGSETCDDGNTVDENSPSVHPNPADTCPANCIIGTCGAGTTTAQTASVNISVPGATPLGGITVFLDYPDAKTSIPGSGAGVGGSITNVPGGSLSSPNDLDYGLLEGVVNLSGLAPGRLFTVTFQNCPGAPALVVGDFGCVVKDASDTSGNDVAGVTCSVSFP
jgi:hypothetical protein